MSKQQIHIKIDTDTYLLLKASNTNISDTANKLFKDYFNENIETDEIKLVNEERELSEKIKEFSDRRNQVIVNLVKLREDKVKKDKEHVENVDAMTEGLLRSGVLH